ncbi:MAG: efflux RND transporter permease subunit, partial [Rhizobiales bacterium]|nr:efflux RND transporter permease subunit [Hyphomicrobiales bacterium]
VLTLLALLLAIGLVVDDAIVVLENIKRRLDLGESPLVACSRGTRQVTFAVVATSLTLIAVFIPISFLQGQAGRLFTEFGFVMASAVAISTFVALSLCPVLSAMLLAPSTASVAPDGPATPAPAIGYFGAAYRHLLERALGARLIVIVLAAAFAAGSYGLYQGLARELAPKEDRGRIFLLLSAPQGSTSSYTDAEVRSAERALQPMVDEGLIGMVYSIVGSWGRPDRAFMVLRLPDWEDRDLTDAQIARRIMPIAGKLTGARGFPSTPTGLGLRGSRSPLRVVVGGSNYAEVKQWAEQLLARAEENPGLVGPDMDFEENQAQLDVHIDRSRADDLGISVEEVGATLQTMFASREVTQFIERGRAYPVLLQAGAADRRTPGDISNIFVRSGDGETLVPLSALVEISESASAPTLRRYDRLPSVVISSGLAPDYSLGAAIEFMEQAAAETLPDEARIALAGPSQQFRETSSGVAITFALAVLIVFLVLAAQFESFVHPVVIMLSVPLAVAGAIYALSWSGISLNIYSQIGIILLIGLMAKNGILIVEFANQLRDQGRSVREAVIEASVLRVRPIVMTVVSTMLGAVPLVLASGAGAEARIAIGTVVIGGLGLASVLTLFLTPVLYDLMAGMTRPRGAIEKALEAELGSATGVVLEAGPGRGSPPGE